MSQSPSQLPPITIPETAGNTPSLIDPKDKLDELQGTFKYAENRVRIIRDLTEIHEVTLISPDQQPCTVYVKYLRYATILASDIHLTTEEKRKKLKRILGQMIKWTSIQHPNVLPYLGYQWNDTPLLVFYWYKNGNISQYLEARRDADRLKLLLQVSQGLAFLHSQSIVHGDIKPNNVIISDDGHAMLMDFGLAPDLRAVERNMTIANSGRGEVGYMSPELIEEGNYTKATDVYALGALILEIMSHHPPFYNYPYVQAMIKISNKSKPSPVDHQDLPSSSPLWGLMQDCWSTLPQDRPSIDEVVNKLQSMVKGKRSWLFGRLGSLGSFVIHLVTSVVHFGQQNGPSKPIST